MRALNPFAGALRSELVFGHTFKTGYGRRFSGPVENLVLSSSTPFVSFTFLTKFFLLVEKT